MHVIGMVGVDAQDNDPLFEAKSDDSTDTIFGGVILSEEERRQRPFLVNLGRDDGGLDDFFCAGSLVSTLVLHM